MKKLGFLFVVFGILFSTATASATFQWRNLGRAPLLGDVTNGQTFQLRVQSHKTDLVVALAQSRSDWRAEEIYDDLNSFVQAGKWVRNSFPSGTNFPTMAFKGGNGITVVRDVQWCGEESLDGYSVQFESGGKQIDLFFPYRCGNLVPLSAVPITTVAAPVAGGGGGIYIKNSFINYSYTAASPAQTPQVVYQPAPTYYQTTQPYYSPYRSSGIRLGFNFGHRAHYSQPQYHPQPRPYCPPSPCPPPSSPYCPPGGSPGGR